jgi:hypothetical protein
MDISSIGKAILVFVLVFFTDALWTIYIQSAAKNKSLQAASASAILVLIGGVNIWLFVHSPWLLVPEMLGGFAGTYYIIERSKRKKVGPPSQDN